MPEEGAPRFRNDCHHALERGWGNPVAGGPRRSQKGHGEGVFREYSQTVTKDRPSGLYGPVRRLRECGPTGEVAGDAPVAPCSLKLLGQKALVQTLSARGETADGHCSLAETRSRGGTKNESRECLWKNVHKHRAQMQVVHQGITHRAVNCMRPRVWRKPSFSLNRATRFLNEGWKG
jgi:hypothetical protein